jgi:virginiamycin A acetyltransferase
LFFVDFTDNYNIYERVIEQFIDKYKDNFDYQLVLFVDRNFLKDNIDSIDKFYKYVEYQTKKAKTLCKLNICIDDINKSRSLFKAINYYITSRAKETVLYTGYADEFNVKIISGVDTYIFH